MSDPTRENLLAIFAELAPAQFKPGDKSAIVATLTEQPLSVVRLISELGRAYELAHPRTPNEWPAPTLQNLGISEEVIKGEAGPVVTATRLEDWPALVAHIEAREAPEPLDVKPPEGTTIEQVGENAWAIAAGTLAGDPAVLKAKLDEASRCAVVRLDETDDEMREKLGATLDRLEHDRGIKAPTIGEASAGLAVLKAATDAAPTWKDRNCHPLCGLEERHAGACSAITDTKGTVELPPSLKPTNIDNPGETRF